MTEPPVIKRTRGPRKARNRLQEMAFAGKAFIKATDNYAGVAAAKFGIEQSADLSTLLEVMSEASEAARSVHKAFEPHYEAIRREAELIRSNAELEAMARSMAEALRTSGHSDKIPDRLKAPIQPLPKPRGRPPKASNEQAMSISAV